VVLADGDDASGLAVMLAELLADNLRDFPVRAEVARRARGDLVLTASDREISVTLSFRPGEVVVSNGATERAPALRGPWLEMAKLCSGQESPVVALARRHLQLVPGARMTVVPAGGFVLSVPASFYGDNSQRRQVAVGGGIAAVVLVLLIRRRRRRRAR